MNQILFGECHQTMQQCQFVEKSVESNTPDQQDLLMEAH